MKAGVSWSDCSPAVSMRPCGTPALGREDLDEGIVAEREPMDVRAGAGSQLKER